MIDFRDVVDQLTVGVIIVTRSMEVVFWNRWMEEHSRVPREEVVGKVLTEKFPALKQKGFAWKAETVFKLGNFAFFSNKHHQFLFEFQNVKYFRPSLSQMQQNVILAPLRGPDGTVDHVCVSIFDVTDAVLYEQQLVESKKKLEELSKIDELTGISNRRHLMERLREELSHYKRSSCGFAVILLDVDNFKSVNDLRGHLCGDYVLRELASILKGQLREYDILGRYGGEEFGIVLPGVTVDQAMTVAERLRSKVEKSVFEHDSDKFNITITLGLASTEFGPEMSPNDLFKIADECLYQGKSSGRNCVVVHNGDAVQGARVVSILK